MLHCRTKSNVAKRKKTDEESESGVVPSTSRELADTPKPEMKITKRYKESSKLEAKMIEYLDKSPAETSKKEEDMITFQMAAIEHMTRESVPKEKHINILFALVHQVQRYIDNLQQVQNQVPVNAHPVYTNSNNNNNEQNAGGFATLTAVPMHELNRNYEAVREVPFTSM